MEARGLWRACVRPGAGPWDASGDVAGRTPHEGLRTQPWSLSGRTASRPGRCTSARPCSSCGSPGPRLARPVLPDVHTPTVPGPQGDEPWCDVRLLDPAGCGLGVQFRVRHVPAPPSWTCTWGHRRPSSPGRGRPPQTWAGGGGCERTRGAGRQRPRLRASERWGGGDQDRSAPAPPLAQGCGCSPHRFAFKGFPVGKRQERVRGSRSCRGRPEHLPGESQAQVRGRPQLERLERDTALR